MTVSPDERADGQRLAETLTRERGRLTRMVQSRLDRLSPLEAEDVVADVVIGLLERADLLAEVENLTAYLFRSVTNRLRDLMRRHRPTEELSPELADPAPNPEQMTEQGQWRRLLDNALAQLSPPERAVWLAVEVEGHSYRHLADQWNQPIGTLLSRKSRAEKALKRLLDCPDEGGQTP